MQSSLQGCSRTPRCRWLLRAGGAGLAARRGAVRDGRCGTGNAGWAVDGGGWLAGVVLVLDEELRRAVPARDDVLGHAPVLLGARVGVDRPRQPCGGGAEAAAESRRGSVAAGGGGASRAKVADLEVAVLVDEQVAGLEVAVED